MAARLRATRPERRRCPGRTALPHGRGGIRAGPGVGRIRRKQTRNRVRAGITTTRRAQSQDRPTANAINRSVLPHTDPDDLRAPTRVNWVDITTRNRRSACHSACSAGCMPSGRSWLGRQAGWNPEQSRSAWAGTRRSCRTVSAWRYTRWSAAPCRMVNAAGSGDRQLQQR
jgi:hypothetical protein